MAHLNLFCQKKHRLYFSIVLSPNIFELAPLLHYLAKFWIQCAYSFYLT